MYTRTMVLSRSNILACQESGSKFYGSPLGFFSGLETAEVLGFTIDLESDPPHALGNPPVDIAGPELISGVQVVGHDAQVGSPVIESIVVDMVNLHRFDWLSQQGVHLQAGSFVAAATPESGLSISASGQAPSMWPDKLNVGSVDDGASGCLVFTADFHKGQMAFHSDFVGCFSWHGDHITTPFMYSNQTE